MASPDAWKAFGWFREAKFRVKAHDTAGGRRVNVHDIPSLDYPIVEDIGLNARRVRFQAYTVGENYLADRDALLAACSRAGFGELWHPYIGSMLCVCETISTSEDRDQFGICAIDMAFVEVEEASPFAKSTKTSVKQEASDAQSALGTAAEKECATTIIATAAPQQVIDATTNETTKLAQALALLGAAQTQADKASEFALKVTNLLNNAAKLATTPVNLAAQIHDAIDSVEDAASNAFGSLYAYQTLDLLRPDVHSTYGETNNSGAVINAVRAHAVAGWARAMLSTSFKSYEDALEARDRFTASLDEQMLSASDASYAALLALRGSISEAVPDPASNLPRLRQITLAATIPSLVLASKLYDKTSRWSDVVERNGVRNPMFVPGGVSLTVLTG